VTEAKFCPHCGKKQEQAVAFCGACGKSTAQAGAAVEGNVKQPSSKKPLIAAVVVFVMVAVLGYGAWLIFFAPPSMEEYREQTIELWNEVFEATLDAEAKLNELNREYEDRWIDVDEYRSHTEQMLEIAGTAIDRQKVL